MTSFHPQKLNIQTPEAAWIKKFEPLCMPPKEKERRLWPLIKIPSILSTGHEG
jgi:hypothetical protein